jgi:hypothetical protein
MRISRLLFYVLLTISFSGRGQQTESKANKKPYSLVLTPKFHSTGHSPYSGVYLNHHFNADIGLNYKCNQYEAFISKNMDFVDSHSTINFMTVGFSRYFQLTKSIKLTSYAGYFFMQSYSFMDKNSDMWAAIAVKFTINKWFAIENTSLVGNLVRHYAHASIANRLHLELSVGKFKFNTYTWYTHSINNPHFVSTSVAITTPDWMITKSISARVQVAMLQYVTNERPEGAMNRGGLISLIFPIELSPTTSKKH